MIPNLGKNISHRWGVRYNTVAEVEETNKEYYGT